MKFNEIELQEKVLKSLEKNNYLELTPIQEKIIPAIQEGNDVLGCSQTGSGKTGAFLIPILSRLIGNKNKKAIIVAPTRELAIQIMDNAKLFSENDKTINKTLIIGGAPIREQLLSIRKGVRLIVGTPGRINDFLSSDKLNIKDFDILVLDEMDRMLDMGFSVQIDEIIKNLSNKRQTLLFSATISKKIEKVTEKYLKNPIIIKIGETNKPSINITQEIIEIDNSKKFDKVVEILKGSTVFTLVFVKTKFGTERLSEKLSRENILAKAIHGDLKQNKRAKIIQEFRDKKFNVLVATDVAARGLDIHHIDTVINYDLPQSPEDYIHRIGRCSRGIDTKGCSISFCNKEDRRLLNAIQSLIKDGEYNESDVARKTGTRQRSSNRKNDNRSSSRDRQPRSNSRSSSRDGQSTDNSRDGRSNSRDRQPRDGSRENTSRDGQFKERDRNPKKDGRSRDGERQSRDGSRENDSRDE